MPNRPVLADVNRGRNTAAFFSLFAGQVEGVERVDIQVHVVASLSFTRVLEMPGGGRIEGQAAAHAGRAAGVGRLGRRRRRHRR